MNDRIKYTEREAISSLERKGCKIDFVNKIITIPSKVLLGNRSFGKLGFLRYYKKYEVVKL